MVRRIGPAATLSSKAGQRDDAAFELLEPRALLSGFSYHDLNGFLDPAAPLYVLRPGGDDGAIRTIGSAVDAVGDIDRDGFNDILVGAGGRNSGQQTRAVAAVYSGRTGGLLLSFSDGFSEFGASVAGVGDVNGDGVPDIAVGSPQFDTEDHGRPRETGRVYLYSGADGAIIRTFTGGANGDRFGAALAGAGDFDNDGVPDIIIGAPGADGAGEDRGRAYVYSGDDGALLETFEGLEDDDAFGYAVDGAGDVDQDGFDDVIVGAPGRFQGPQRTQGHAYVFSADSRARIFTFAGDEDGDWFGFSVAGVGDINGDGRVDVAVGAPSAWNRENGNIPSAGLARVYSGANGAVLWGVRGDAPNINLGASVAAAGDANLDGRADVIIAAPAASPAGYVGVFSGATGRSMIRYSHTTSDLLGGDRLGGSVAALGDVNGDGFGDFVFAATQDANPERNDRGRMYVFSGASLAPLLPEGLNNDRDIWGTSGDQGFLILNGQLFRLPARGGFMGGDRVIDVNLSDSVLGGRDAAGHDGFVWRSGVRTSLESMVVSVEGPQGDFSGFRAVDVTDSGLILLERLRDGATPTAWVLDNGVLRYLFDGVPVAMNEARMVVGTLGDGLTSVVWTAQGGVMQIDGFRVADLNEQGTLAGLSEDGPAVWATGTITPIGRIDGGDDYIVRAISNDGEVVGTYRVGGATSGFYYRPGEGIRDIEPLVTVGAPSELAQSGDLRLADINDEGDVVGAMYDYRRGFLLDRFDDSTPFQGVIGQGVDVTTTADGTATVATVNAAGRVIVFRRDPGTADWRAIDLTAVADVAPADEAVVFVDPSTGRVSVAVRTANGLVLVEERANGAWHARNLTQEIAGAQPITGSLFSLTPMDGLVLVGGLAANGDVVIYGMTASTGSDGRVWAYDNISESQLRDNGIGVPAYQGRLVTYVTPWNGLNIAGIDSNGDVRVMWTAPGVLGWRETNLSDVAGTPVLVGGLSAYVTPWGGMNVVGVDTRGHIVVTWWVPGFGGAWEKNDFTAEHGGQMLRPESVTSYVAPWGGLNVGGISDDGRVVVYWWVPGFNGDWRVDSLDVHAEDGRMLPARRLTSHVGEDGTFHVVGVGRFGDVLDMRWTPTGGWNVERLG